MRAETRDLFGDRLLSFEVTAPCSDPDAYVKILKAAARLIREEEPGSVTVSGIRMNTQDEFVLDVILGSA